VRASVVRLTAHASTLRRRIEDAGVQRTFFICSTPRTGSMMLADLLADTGLAGRADEFFGEPFRKQVVPGLTRRGFDDYLVGCTRKTEQGTFGVKLHWDQVEVFLHLLRLRRGLGGLSDAGVIEAVFPAPSYVFLTREDTLAQAVSWWKAIASGKWVDEESPAAEPEFDADGIAGRVRRIGEHNEAWRRWFEANGVEPLRVTYEELAADPATSARRVLEHVGVDVPPDLGVEPRTERQADAVNAEWIRRYRELSSGSEESSTA
jgi:LPS sulfotransferase NodH